MNLIIIEADGLELGFVAKHSYVKILWRDEVFKTPPSSKATSVRGGGPDAIASLQIPDFRAVLTASET